MIKAIVFSLENIVIMNEWKSRKEAIEKETGISIEMNADVAHLKSEVDTGKARMEDLIAQIVEESGKDVSVAEVIESYKMNYEKFATLNPKMTYIVKMLGNMYELYAFSNSNNLHEEINSKRAVYKLFKEVFLSNEIGFVKPDSKAFDIVLKSIGIPAAEILFVDDDERNIEAAIKIGMQSILYKDEIQLIMEMKKLGVGA